EQSFIPHGLAASTDPVEPVQIGHGQEPPHGFETLVNLHSEVPLFFSRFERVAEIVPADEAARQTARERYRFYKDRGYPLKTHRL
ncbi:MAG: DNA polymerase III subunit chi, partial [Gammaproteobacteria bacterium]